MVAAAASCSADNEKLNGTDVLYINSRTMRQETSPPSLLLSAQQVAKYVIGEKYAIVLRKCEYRCLLWRRASHSRWMKLYLKQHLKQRN